ncbi:MAG: sialate O-acetylesterase [Bacteroidetes bacterium]|nr:sialate O-acetylesterase [Bacteroidota bacterium]
MVLQRGRPVPVWGLAPFGARVSVGFGGQRKEVVANGRGEWRCDLDAMDVVREGKEMVVSDDRGEAVRFKNVLVGEVWLCSGQSNMEYTMRKNSKFDTVEEAGNPEIRLFLVGTHYSKPETHGVWSPAVGEALRGFSAPGYFFAKELNKQLGVPVGVIANAVPGSAIEPYLGDSGKFYQTMVRPLAPYGIKGFCWYQGETNCMLNDTVAYPGKMKRLIEGWRGIWGGADLPFYFVQIAPYYYSKSNGGNQAHSVESEADFWGAQEKALALPHTGMVVTSDLVDSLQDLHPGHKREVGRRLALWALAKDYGRQVVYSGPVFKGLAAKGRRIGLSFSDVGSGLVSRDGKALSWFEVAGADGGFVAAKAKIQGSDKVLVVSPVKDPRVVRFGWNEAAQPNLFNKEGLPAMPFRTTID